VGQSGFWDEQQRVSKLLGKKPVLRRLRDSIPRDLFRPLLERGYTQERTSNAGRNSIDPLILFKMLVLQQLFNLSVGVAFSLRLLHRCRPWIHTLICRQSCLYPQQPDTSTPA